MIKKWIESIVINILQQRGIDLTESGKIILTLDVWKPVDSVKHYTIKPYETEVSLDSSEKGE